MITRKLIGYLACFLVLLSSCKKSIEAREAEKHAQLLASQNDSTEQNRPFARQADSVLYQEAVAALQAQQDTCSTAMAARIDTILQNMETNVRSVIALDDTTDIVVFDLAWSRRTTLRDYSNAFYKIYFAKVNGVMRDGMIYSIYTDKSESSVNADFENIFNQESTDFTGKIEVNYLNGYYGQGVKFSNGTVTEMEGLSPLDKYGLPGDGIGQNCTTWWLVTTSFYSDGRVEQEWDLLGTYCNNSNCVPTGVRAASLEFDCDGVGGGGGSDPAPTVEEPTQKEGFFLTTLVMGDAGSCTATFQYDYVEVRQKGFLTHLFASAAWCHNRTQDCSYLGKSCERKITVGQHAPNVTLYGLTGLRASWGFQVFWTYKFNDGTPTITGEQYIKKTRVFS